MSDVVSLAIDAALRKNFKKAIELNRQIIKENPHDIEALNRLAFALSETGKFQEAKELYNKVLSLNRFNPIALKNLKRLALVKGTRPKKGNHQVKSQTTNKAGLLPKGSNFAGLFLEEVGKTKVVALINLAEAKIISTLHPTDSVVLEPRRRGVSITTSDGNYIGALPDDIAKRLFVLLKGGNEYEAYIKSANRAQVSIFIRELVRKAKFRNQPSFLGKGSSYYPFVREEVLAEEGKPDVSRLEDLDEEEEEGKTESAEEETES